MSLRGGVRCIDVLCIFHLLGGALFICTHMYTCPFGPGIELAGLILTRSSRPAETKKLVAVMGNRKLDGRPRGRRSSTGPSSPHAWKKEICRGRINWRRADGEGERETHRRLPNLAAAPGRRKGAAPSVSELTTGATRRERTLNDRPFVRARENLPQRWNGA
jgi:hypothetical protein